MVSHLLCDVTAGERAFSMTGMRASHQAGRSTNDSASKSRDWTTDGTQEWRAFRQDIGHNRATDSCDPLQNSSVRKQKSNFEVSKHSLLQYIEDTFL